MPHSGTSLKRLWIEKGEDECWPWLGRINKRTGYGQKRYFKRDFLAHRWMYEQRVGPIPNGKVINHLCGNRTCVNPAHLEAVSQADNCRHGKGAKLDIHQVHFIKQMKPMKCWGDGARLSRLFGVSSALIHDIWNGRAWANNS